MILPSSGSDRLIQRQAESLDEPLEPTTTRTTYIPKATNTSTEPDSSDGFIAQAEATTNLSWWQLLCIAIGGTLLLTVIMWVMWRARRKKANEKRRAKDIEQEEEKRMKELIEKRRLELARRNRGRGHGGWDSDSEESYDSVSDGGTIRPKRRKRRGRRRHRERRRRDTESESDWTYSEDSDGTADTYYPRRTRRRRRREDDYRDRDDRRRHRYDIRRSSSSEPSPSIQLTTPQRGPERPNPNHPSPPSRGGTQDKNFRDSVFSTYRSMKQAAVKLKQVEAKAKLQKALDQEEEIEAARKAKVREANMAIERERRAEKSAGSSQPLIPPVDRDTVGSSTISSSGTPHLPTPPPQSAAQRGHSGYSSNSGNSRSRTTTAQKNPHTRTLYPPQPPQRQSQGLHSEIHQLLGNRPDDHSKPTIPALVGQPKQPVPRAAPRINNDFQASWLAHPGPTVSVRQSPRSGSVYVPVTQPKDRPIIPPGGLARAPPPKAKSKATSGLSTGFGSAYGGVSSETPSTGSPMGSSRGAGNGAGAGARKWANRLRARK